MTQSRVLAPFSPEGASTGKFIGRGVSWKSGSKAEKQQILRGAGVGVPDIERALLSSPEERLLVEDWNGTCDPLAGGDWFDVPRSSRVQPHIAIGALRLVTSMAAGPRGFDLGRAAYLASLR